MSEYLWVWDELTEGVWPDGPNGPAILRSRRRAEEVKIDRALVGVIEESEVPITCDWCTNPTLQVAREHCEAELCPFKAKLEAAEQAETSYY